MSLFTFFLCPRKKVTKKAHQKTKPVPHTPSFGFWFPPFDAFTLQFKLKHSSKGWCAPQVGV